jgi:hypothetical protein
LLPHNQSVRLTDFPHFVSGQIAAPGLCEDAVLGMVNDSAAAAPQDTRKLAHIIRHINGADVDKDVK